MVQVFGNSPDETAYCRVLLNRETCNDAITMIQPAMQAYSMSSPQPEPVMLDVASVMPDRVLLLDSYFTVVVWHGSTVAQWRKADYHLQEEYAHLKPLMEVSNQAKLTQQGAAFDASYARQVQGLWQVL